MKLATRTLVLTVAASGLAMAAMSSAHADAFAQSILVIDNFRLLHSTGTAFNVTDFGVLSGGNAAGATAQLGAGSATATQSQGIMSLNTPDVAHQTVGSAAAARPENNFAPFPSAPPVAGTFAYADQNLSGNPNTIGMAPAGARAQTRADASLAMNGSASGYAGLGTAISLRFALGAGDSMTVAFDATPYTQAYVSGGAGSATNAIAGLSWSINIVDMTTGTTVFAYQPTELNALSNVSRSDGFAGTSTYSPGSLTFSATTPFLNGSDTYQMTILQSTAASAMQAVPEPATLGVFGLGLLGISILGRRRKP
jgi:PEP-CTERM motif